MDQRMNEPTAPIDTIVISNVILTTGDMTSVEIDIWNLADLCDIDPFEVTEVLAERLALEYMEGQPEMADLSRAFVEGVYRADFKEFMAKLELDQHSSFLPPE